jgi:hypothetical protein
MRALQFSEYGSPEVLTWGDAPLPHAGAGEIRITVRAASVNPLDWKILSGAMSGGRRWRVRVTSDLALLAWWTSSAKGCPGYRWVMRSLAAARTLTRSARC